MTRGGARRGSGRRRMQTRQTRHTVTLRLPPATLAAMKSTLAAGESINAYGTAAIAAEAARRKV